jgi:hypothetical protein
MENFDAVGQYRSTENGVSIDASGTFYGVPYKDLIGFQKALAKNAALSSCLVKRAFEYGAGHTTSPGEREWMTYLNSSFAKDGYRVPALMRRIATSPAFRVVAADNSASQ